MQEIKGKFFRKPTNSTIKPRIPAFMQKKNNPEVFKFISPKHNDSLTLSLHNPRVNVLEKEFQLNVIKLENQKLTKSIQTLKQVRAGILVENYSLKDRLKQYQIEMEILKQNSSQNQQKQETLEETNINNQLFDQIQSEIQNQTLDNQYEKLKERNKMLQQNLQNSNKIVFKLRNALQSANINLAMLQRKLLKRDKQICKLKCKYTQSQLFEISDDEEK